MLLEVRARGGAIDDLHVVLSLALLLRHLLIPRRCSMLFLFERLLASQALVAKDMRDPTISNLVAR